MSKNYTNYSKFNAADTEPAVHEAVGVTEEPEEVLEEQIELEFDPEQLVEAVGEAIAADMTPPPAPMNGVVTAGKLNIRKLPSPNGEVVAQVAQNTTLQIDTEASTAEWYKVYTPAGIDGYCMKKFVTIK